MTVTSAVETITPAQATEALSRNPRNRKIKPSLVQRYAAELAGNWKLNGEAIVYGLDGSLLDGQHRLMACSQSGIPFKTIVVRGVDPSVFDTIDQGYSRSLTDALSMAGESNPLNLAAAALLTYAWEQDWDFTRAPTSGFKKRTRLKLSSTELKDTIARNSGLRYSLSLIYNMPYKQVTTMISISLAAAVHHILSQESSPENAEAFIKLLATGANMDYGHPILMLRNQLLNLRAGRAGSSLAHRQHLLGLIFKSWNAWREGRQVGLLRWQPSEGIPEIVA